MQNTDDIVAAFGGYAALAAAIGRPAGTVSAWKTRQSIPAEYWPSIVATAERLRIDGVTFEALATIAAARPRGSARPASAVAQA